MDERVIKHYWHYFCSLCEQLDKTRQYVEHHAMSDSNNPYFENGKTYSNEFMKILLATASEFETVGKLLCKEIDSQLPTCGNIVKISDTILKKFPNIGKTQVFSDYATFLPLANWKIEPDKYGNSTVCGLEWWRIYTELKHSRYVSFPKANLENCIYALASLLVLELYLAMQALGSVSSLSGRCPYFHFRYGHEPYWVRCPDNLPDFG